VPSLPMSPRKRLSRTIDGLLWALSKQRPLLSDKERQLWLGLVLIRNRDRLIAEALSL
jgi:hypothetical protein